MPLISHRGAAGLAPENSKQGIVIARAYHPRYIEVDIHCTFDGVFVVYHGDVAQTYTGHRLSETHSQLMGKVPHLLTLRELLVGHAGTTQFMFDVKCADDIDELIVFLQEHGLSGHAYTSPHVGALRKLAQTYIGSPTFIAQAYKKGPFKALSLAKKHGFSGVSLSKWWLNPLTYLGCRLYKKQLMVYTVNTKTGINIVQKLYRRAFVCTNFPDIYRSVFSQVK